MKNHFLISYAGNKRKECHEIYDSIKDKLITTKTIIEPFCGSSAVSYYISTLHPKQFKYILNDNNKHLIELYTIAKSKSKLKKFIKDINVLVKGITKEIYKELVKKDNVQSWFIKNSIYSIKAGMFPLNHKIKDDFSYLEQCPIINFLRTEKIAFSNIEAIELIKKHSDDSTVLMFLDPPYLNVCNDFYLDSKTNIYEHLYKNKITDMKACVILCLESNWIISLLFDGLIRKTYDKTYETSKKKTSHIVITNFINIK